jgi:hypothetical protein
MDPSGRPVLGEPQSAQAKEKAKREGESHSLFQSLHIPTLSDLTNAGDNLSEYSFPVKPVLGVLGGLVALWVVWGLLSGPGEAVADRSRIVAEALMRDDLNKLKTFASSETLDDVVRWYDAAHPKLDEARKAWPSKDGSVSVVVVEEDHSNGKGETEVFFAPSGGATQVASVMPGPPPAVGLPPSSKPKGLAAAGVPVVTGPLSFHLFWIKSGSHWYLDGRQSFAMATR